MSISKYLVRSMESKVDKLIIFSNPSSSAVPTSSILYRSTDLGKYSHWNDVLSASYQGKLAAALLLTLAALQNTCVCCVMVVSRNDAAFVGVNPPLKYAPTGITRRLRKIYLAPYEPIHCFLPNHDGRIYKLPPVPYGGNHCSLAFTITFSRLQ